MDTPRTSELAALAGISQSYASQIINGKRTPPRPLAIHIFRKTGWRHPLISELSDDQLEVLETIEPWVPRETPTPSSQEAA